MSLAVVRGIQSLTSAKGNFRLESDIKIFSYFMHKDVTASCMQEIDTTESVLKK